jgi:hypothetical protein
MSTKNAATRSGGPLMRYDDRAAGECSPAPGPGGGITEAGERISKARARVWDLISQLNERADAVFGATPTPLEGKLADPAPGALAMLFVEIDELERAVPSLERAVERFTNLA